MVCFYFLLLISRIFFHAASSAFLLLDLSDSDSRLCVLVGLLQLEFASETLLLAILAESGVVSRNDLALNLASGTDLAGLLESTCVRGSGRGGSSARRGGAGVGAVPVSITSSNEWLPVSRKQLTQGRG